MTVHGSRLNARILDLLQAARFVASVAPVASTEVPIIGIPATLGSAPRVSEPVHLPVTRIAIEPVARIAAEL